MKILRPYVSITIFVLAVAGMLALPPYMRAVSQNWVYTGRALTETQALLITFANILRFSWWLFAAVLGGILWLFTDVDI